MVNFRLIRVLGRWGAVAVVLFGAAGLAWAQADGGVPTLNRQEAWTPDEHARPATGCGPGGEEVIAANGTHTCCGGLQYYYTGVQAGQAYRLSARVRHEGLEQARDSLAAVVLWDYWKPGEVGTNYKAWNYLMPTTGAAPDTIDFQAVLRAPPGASSMTIRYVFRWSERGSSHWSLPKVAPVTLPPLRPPVKVCVVSETRQTAERIKMLSCCDGSGLPEDVSKSVDRWAALVSAACERKPQLIVTPEIAVGGKALVEGAVTVPGPATGPFEALAKQHQVYIVLGVRERSGDAIYNSAALIGPEGKVLGVYRKVHLATGEGLSGVSPGNSFPVFQTGIGRIGCMICMDTTVCESARMLALNGAEFICFPIMGDLRADRWSPGPPIYNEDRWKAIMRTRAMDNQLCMVVARNGAQGSCIIDRKGDILAWNEGDQEIIEATVQPEEVCRMWDGGEFREITFMLRRPQLYGAYTETGRVGTPGSTAR